MIVSDNIFIFTIAYSITLEVGRIMPSEPNLDDGRSPFLLFPPLSSIGTCIRIRTHTHKPPTLLHRLGNTKQSLFFLLVNTNLFVAFIPVQKIKPCFSFIMYLSFFLPSFPCYFTIFTPFLFHTQWVFVHHLKNALNAIIVKLLIVC